MINRSANEGIVEVEVKSIKYISTFKRPQHNLTSERLNFMSTNGPHPFVATDLVKDSPNSYFGRDVHFHLSKSPYFTSKVVDRHFKEAKNLPNCLVEFKGRLVSLSFKMSGLFVYFISKSMHFFVTANDKQTKGIKLVSIIHNVHIWVGLFWRQVTTAFQAAKHFLGP